MKLIFYIYIYIYIYRHTHTRYNLGITRLNASENKICLNALNNIKKRGAKQERNLQTFFFFSLTWVSGPACAHLD